MADGQSAAARVFGITELLDAIIYWVCKPPVGDENILIRQSAGLLRTSKACYLLATRYVWRVCGRYGGPCRYDLGKMADHPERLQWYADAVECLYIRSESHPTRRRQAYYELPEVRTRLDRLPSNLKFPRLRRIRVESYGAEADLTSAALPYLRYGFKRLEVCTTHVSAQFWVSLKVKTTALSWKSTKRHIANQYIGSLSTAQRAIPVFASSRLRSKSEFPQRTSLVRISRFHDHLN